MNNWLLILATLFPVSIFADSSVWRVSQGQHELIIGGTIHVLGQTDYPLPVEFEKAYQSADKLVLETDLAKISEPDFQTQLLSRMLYPSGQTLETVLSKETYDKLKNFCQLRGFALEPLASFKASMVVMTLMMMELQRLGLAESGVDQHFNQKAIADNKAMGSLETVEKQLSVLEEMGQGHEDDLVSSTLQELEDLPRMLGQMKTAWRIGDLESLEMLGLKPLQTDYPEIFESLLLNRNQDWLPQLETMVMTPEHEMVLVGALHLAGAKGLLAQLRNKGYTVTPFRD